MRRAAGQFVHRARSTSRATRRGVVADAPKVVWALDFQLGPTIDGKAIKTASMLDGHIRESLLHLV
jgi:hypothetical protein